MEPYISHSYVQLNRSLVHIAQYCSNGENFFKFTSKSKVSKVVIFVPGNPGVLGIYHDFLTTTFKSIRSSILKDFVILAIGHNNFDHTDHVRYKTNERIIIDDSDMNFVENSLASKYVHEPHHIELQVLNKLVILKKLLDLERTRIVFVGHSIGAYIILRLLQDSQLSSAHDGSVLIHPALENLATTAKGSSCVTLFRYKLDTLIKLFLSLLDMLPMGCKLMLLKFYCSDEFLQRSSDVTVESVVQLACHRSINALFQMAKSELQLVKNLNPEIMLKPHSSKIRLIYAINDHWVNNDNRRLLQEACPDLYIEEQPRMHAFVMEPSTVMDYSVKVGMYIQDFFGV